MCLSIQKLLLTMYDDDFNDVISEENETSVSDDEFMKITQNLWNYDDNRAVTLQDYVTNKQSYTSGSSKFDSSALP